MCVDKKKTKKQPPSLSRADSK